jgi:hypothetical protein
MTEAALGNQVLIFLAAFHAAPLLALTAAVLIAWFIFALSDAPSPLAMFLTVLLLLTFGIQAALLLSPAFSGGW